MKITLSQLSFHTGNFEGNTQKMIAAIEQAKQEGTDLIVFSELATCGYPARDFLEFKDFIAQAEQSILTLASYCVGIAAIIGSPRTNPVIEGKDLYNAAYFLENGGIKQIVDKTLLPNYDIFDEYRYFEPNRHFELITFQEFKIALTICEDLWNLNDNPMYITTPLDELIKQGPDFVINIAASPYSQIQIEERRKMLLGNAKKYKLPIFYVNHIGAQTHLVFDGGSCFISKGGTIEDELNYFEEDTHSYLVEKTTELTIQSSSSSRPVNLIRNKYKDIEAALTLGIKQYFQKLGFSKAILGLSGGIDSALVTYLAERALGKENVWAVLLPSQYSSDHSISDSITLANNLGIKNSTIPIENTFQSFLTTLDPFFEGTPFGLTEENLQSRTRGVLLMGLANKFGYILLNTSNKSELAVGYGTLYGDMCGGISVIGDLYKTEIFELCKYINRDKEIIPTNILTKEPSAELRPEQKDSDSLPAYEILDQILHYYIEERMGPAQIAEQGFDPSLVQRILKMVNMNEWKRWQAPPVLRVSKKAFGPGRRVPISGKYLY
ncbi:MAG: NAD+ synthase [Bacteroidetes bacterium B1(2017)]|nr:MAG: NAD+ synthase [Bacteroidetes bacterium B1(2017)]